jgi:hypothetical protein
LRLGKVLADHAEAGCRAAAQGMSRVAVALAKGSALVVLAALLLGGAWFLVDIRS